MREPKGSVDTPPRKVDGTPEARDGARGVQGPAADDGGHLALRVDDDVDESLADDGDHKAARLVDGPRSRLVRSSALGTVHPGAMGAMRRPSAVPSEAEAFFAESALGLSAYLRVQRLLDEVGACELRVARTQVGWARRRGFASLWMPGRWLRTPSADVVLTLASDRRIDSPRWKEVVEVGQDLFMHHLELRSVDDIDDEVAAWLAQAYRAAG